MPLILTYNDLAARGIPLSANRLWRLEREGKFPRRVNITAGRIGWIASEIDAWIDQRIAERDAMPAPTKRPPRSPGRPRKTVAAAA